MKKQRKPWFLLAVFAPALALAQGQRPQPSATSPQTAAATAPIEPAKRAAIKALLDAIDADKLAAAIGNGAQNQAKQLVPAVLLEALNENKTLNEEQKRTLVPSLQQNVVPQLAEQAGGVFMTPAFKADAVQFQYDAYAKYYTTPAIEDLTKFYKSPAGRKFIQVQDQVGRDTVNGLMGKYMPQAVKEIRDASDQEIAAAKSAPTPSKSSAQSGKK